LQLVAQRHRPRARIGITRQGVDNAPAGNFAGGHQFSVDPDGNLYVASFDLGIVYRLTSIAPSSTDLSIVQSHIPEPAHQSANVTYTVQVNDKATQFKT
jgi:hypothetical protein